MSSERLKPSSEVILTELGDGTGVLLHLATKFYFTLNTTGVIVWKHLEQHREPGALRADVAKELEARFRVDHATADRDLAPLIDALVTEGLVVLAG